MWNVSMWHKISRVNADWKELDEFIVNWKLSGRLYF